MSYAEIYKKYDRAALEAECVYLKHRELDLMRVIFWFGARNQHLMNSDELTLIFAQKLTLEENPYGNKEPKEEKIKIIHPDKDVMQTNQTSISNQLMRWFKGFEYVGRLVN